MAIIAMDREMGSGGKDVAAGVAKALDAALILYEIIDHLADRMRVRKSHVVRLLEDGEDLNHTLTPDDILPAILSPLEVLELASLPESVVLRGWGATALLRNVGHVIRVRVTAPHATRVANLKARVKNPDTAKIEQEIVYSDEAHGAIMRRHFGVESNDPELYHLVLDTAVTPVQDCVKLILALAQDPKFAETDLSRMRLTSLMTESHVKALLKLHPPTRNLAIGIAAEGSEVTLSGAVPTSEIRERCELVAWRVPGMTQVRNQLEISG
ncbi:MAG TPA: cytidylate kinase family protein [Burkholderiales bacterium]|nr:cytidylate kinase family protein [Burkholderiales bacterium]